MTQPEGNHDERPLQPTLTADQIDRLRPYGTEKTVEPGDVLVEEGDRRSEFFLIIEGEVEVVKYRDGETVPIVTKGPGHFTGDIDVLEARPAMASAVVRAPSTVLQLSPACLKEVIAKMPDLSDIILQAFLTRRTRMLSSDFPGLLQIIGSRFSEATHRLKSFAARNDLPYTWLDLERDEGAETLITQFGIEPDDTPVVVIRGERVLRRPSNAELARTLGLGPGVISDDTSDLVVVGGGPAGLAASVYGASEGLSTLCVEADAVGGQAGTSSKIENYLGFPAGLSGAELARRAQLQAEKFGARIAVPQRATALTREEGYYAVELSDGDRAFGRSVVIATGAQYRRLPLDRRPEFDGAGVYYGATHMEAQLCESEDVFVVGGGNSAGQGAIFLSDAAETVYMLLRGGDLTKSMSRYLVDRIRQIENIEVLLHTEAIQLHGNGHLQAVTIANHQTDKQHTIETPALFSFIGAEPCTQWLRGTLPLDDNGFVLTGDALQSVPSDTDAPRRSSVHFLETGWPGVYAVGDVRSDSIKRVASAVGEGSMAVKLVHQFLSGSG
jgi:thioredoxin reductase (NADPH)